MLYDVANDRVNRMLLVRNVRRDCYFFPFIVRGGENVAVHFVLSIRTLPYSVASLGKQHAIASRVLLLPIVAAEGILWAT